MLLLARNAILLSHLAERQPCDRYGGVEVITSEIGCEDQNAAIVTADGSTNLANHRFV